MFDWVLNKPIVSTMKWHTLYLQKIGHYKKRTPDLQKKQKSRPYVKIHYVCHKNTFMVN